MVGTTWKFDYFKLLIYCLCWAVTSYALACLHTPDQRLDRQPLQRETSRWGMSWWSCNIYFSSFYFVHVASYSQPGFRACGCSATPGTPSSTVNRFNIALSALTGQMASIVWRCFLTTWTVCHVCLTKRERFSYFLHPDPDNLFILQQK